jgi:beta-glucanase (GH16 family)
LEKVKIQTRRANAAWRRALFVLLLGICALSVGSCDAATGAPRIAATSHTPQPAGIAGQWKLILNSQFNTPSLDTSLWRPGWFGTGVTRAISHLEPACYSPANVTFPGDGTMHLNVTATRLKCGGITQPFAGAVVTTNPHDGRRSGGFTYRYGVLEAKVFIPGSGSLISNWPSVVTFGQVWPQDGEDDVLEVLNGTACFHYHSPGYAPSGHLGGCDPTFTAGWHTVASDWQPGVVTYYFDGVEIGQITKGVTSAPMYIVLVNTVHQIDRLDPRGAVVDSMQVAYVRVWQAATPANGQRHQ